MDTPRIEVDIVKIRQNTDSIVQRLIHNGISVTGVTKAVCGNPDIAKAMLEGGATELADSRIENVERMRRAGITCPISLIRTPMLSQVDRTIYGCGASYNTELDTIQALGHAALQANAVHEIILMVELGDLREGIMPGDLNTIALQVIKTPGIILKGIGANFACLNKLAVTSLTKMTILSELATEIEDVCGVILETVSGGNSSNIRSIFGGGETLRINELRIGESIFLGVDPISGYQIDTLHADAFTLIAEVIESKTKPLSLLLGDLSAGNSIQNIHQSILSIGYQDTDISGLVMPDGFTFIGATSDHLVIETAERTLAIGTEIAFQVNYSALMRGMNAPSITKVMRH